MALHQRFLESYERRSLLTPEQSAQSLLERLADDATGRVWNVDDSAQSLITVSAVRCRRVTTGAQPLD